MNTNHILQFAEVASAIIAAMGLAMCLEWLTLNGLLRLMPKHVATSGTSSGERKLARLHGSAAKGISGLSLFPH